MHPQPDLEQLRYPVGPPPSRATTGQRQHAIDCIRDLPAKLAEVYKDLDDARLDMPYRPGGWTVRQVAHHIADSHINAYTRLRLALTENWPTIKPYEEALWAELPDARALPVQDSLALLVPLHARWVRLLTSLDESGWERGYLHPESGRVTVAVMTELYAWHGRHHTAHVAGLRERMGW